MVFRAALWLLPLLISFQDAALEVAPWNGSKGAVSLTFDDGDASHLSIAIPELDRRKIRATFFVITSQIGSGAPWKKAAAAGHEIASHSVTHRNPSQFKPDEEDAEVLGAAKALEPVAGRPVISFAYPFSAVTPGLRARIEKVHLLARGGEGNLIAPDSEPDWLNLPSQATLTQGKLETYQGWIQAAEEKRAWSIFMIHGVESSGYSPIPKAVFGGILDALRGKDLWVAPFGEVGAYFRAGRIVNGVKGSSTGEGTRWEWKVPPLFPRGVALKARLDSTHELVQKGGAIKPDAKGLSSFKFEEGSVTFRPKR